MKFWAHMVKWKYLKSQKIFFNLVFFFFLIEKWKEYFSKVKHSKKAWKGFFQIEGDESDIFTAQILKIRISLSKKIFNNFCKFQLFAFCQLCFRVFRSQNRSRVTWQKNNLSLTWWVWINQTQIVLLVI